MLCMMLLIMSLLVLGLLIRRFANIFTVGVTKKFPLHLRTTLVERLPLQKTTSKCLSIGANVLFEEENVPNVLYIKTQRFVQAGVCLVICVLFFCGGRVVFCFVKITYRQALKRALSELPNVV